MPTSPLDSLHHWALKCPDRSFILESLDERLTYAEAWLLAAVIIPQRFKALAPQETFETTPVLILSPNNTLFILSVLGLWHLGSRTVFANVKFDPVLWPEVLRCTDTKIIVAPASLHGKIKLAFFPEQLSQIRILALEDLIPEEYRTLADEKKLPRQSNFAAACRKWVSSCFPGPLDGPTPFISKLRAVNIPKERPAVTMFTSSAVSGDTLKAVTYTHGMLIEMMERNIQMLGGENYACVPKRHMGVNPLCHCFEFCCVLWQVPLSLSYIVRVY